MIDALADELVRVAENAATELRRIDEAAAAQKPGPEDWSVKEIIGHLIDSAANNHQRFIRAIQTNALTFPGYEQDAWVRWQEYQGRPWLELIEFWALYNRHLAHTIRRIPEAALSVPCRIGDSNAAPLRLLVEDYLRHLRHHLSQIAERGSQRT